MNCQSCATAIDEASEAFHLTYFAGGADGIDVSEWFCSGDCIESRLLA